MRNIFSGAELFWRFDGSNYETTYPYCFIILFFEYIIRFLNILVLTQATDNRQRHLSIIHGSTESDFIISSWIFHYKLQLQQSVNERLQQAGYEKGISDRQE